MSVDPIFTIPTCRLRDVGAAVEAYDANFTHYGHELPLFVFDDSGPSLQAKYYSLLTEARTKNALYYVGYREKTELLKFICERLRDRRLEPLVQQLFRPSYGGNRNFTLLYSLGRLFVSADDDMRPFALVQDDGQRLSGDEICKGSVVPAERAPKETRAFDLLTEFTKALGKPVCDVPSQYARGELLVDSAMDLETNASKGLSRENTLSLLPGAVADDATVKMAQTFRSGTNDIDALDFVEMFLESPAHANINMLTDIYVLGQFRPVITNKNWRMDCGVAAYDNRSGLPPFFPTRLRFEDYIYRLWIQQPGMVAAHVAAAQNHSKSAYMRNPPASEVFNEEVANFLKRKIQGSVTQLEPLGVAFDYTGELDVEEGDRILEKMRRLRERVVGVSETCRDVQRTLELVRFAVELESVFDGFDRDLFHYNLRRTLQQTVSAIRSSLQLWPDILEICAPLAAHSQLPCIRLDRH